MIDFVTEPLRVVLISFGANEFATLHGACEQAGHLPVCYVYGRSMKPRTASVSNAGEVVGGILDGIPPGMDLLLPASADGLADALAGYRPDLLVVYGFNWRLPESVLSVPSHGAINIHTSCLPKYRGPAPVLWAIRNGDPEMGVTVHRMDEDFDTGGILAQQGGIPLDEDVDPDRLWTRIKPVIQDLLRTALDRVVAGAAGEPQDDTEASYAGFLEPAFSRVDWSDTVADIHNQVRTFHFMGRDRGPVAEVGGGWVKVLRTSVEPSDGIRVECGDGPIWIVESVPTEAPASR